MLNAFTGFPIHYLFAYVKEDDFDWTGELSHVFAKQLCPFWANMLICDSNRG